MFVGVTLSTVVPFEAAYASWCLELMYDDESLN